MITAQDVAWAAGFFEGEGSIGKRAVLAHQVNRWPLEKLERTFGGTIGAKPRSGRDNNQQPCWHWSIGGEQARLFVRLIYPYLSPRRQEQIDSIFITDEKRQRRRSSISSAFVVEKDIKYFTWPAIISWAAGFYEGEGCVGQRLVNISQVNLFPIQMLVLYFGGAINTPKRTKQENRQIISQWACCGKDGRDFIELIYPYLSPRRQEQIDNTFFTKERLRQNKKDFRRRQAIVSLSRERNAAGQFL